MDGFAVQASDTNKASREHPVMLAVALISLPGNPLQENSSLVRQLVL
jgi:molybdopterin biosynthesis enzyme